MRPVRFKGNVNVSNLPVDFTDGDLANLFDEFGLVLGAMINRRYGEPGQSARGSVALAPPRAVDEAIQSLNGRVLASRKLKVSRAPEEPKRPKPASARPAAAQPGSQPERPRTMAAPAAPAAQSAVGEARPAPARKVIVEYKTRPRRSFAVDARLAGQVSK